jgi:DNA processing protein
MGAANPRTLRLLSHFGGVKATYDALTADSNDPAVSKAFLKPWEIKSLKSSSLEKAAELIRWCEKRGYGIVTFESPDYPEPLKHIYNPPIVLFTEGDISGIGDGVRINVIGTRNPSVYSCRTASHLCGELARVGITIISGMAVGLDKCAMTSALEVPETPGKVAGVLACGIDVDYPRNSRDFRKRVADSGGVCISELMPRDSTRPTYFQYRNRIMSGLSSGTLIIEAGERSGCHITALHALSQNRDLFCVPPHDILDPRYSGVSRYLRDGAIPVFSHIDIVNEYLSDVCERLSESATPRDLEKPTEVKFKKQKTTPQPPPKADYEQAALSEEQAKIIAALQKKKLTFDELLKKKLVTPDNAHELLLDMELDRLIERIAGDSYSLCK